MKLEVQAVGRRFGSNEVLTHVNFSAHAAEITFLYGPSGCGKTTLLRMLAGLDTHYAGSISLDDQPIAGPSARVGLTVQQDLSFPWLEVGANITFGLKYQQVAGRSRWQRMLGKVPGDAAESAARRLAALVGLDQDELHKYPGEISGGMKQRVALARALLPNPALLLLDEPFSALDYEARQALQDVVLGVRREIGMSFVCVSHDPEEVLYLADQIVVLGSEPATVVATLRPDLPLRGTQACKYTPEFQRAKLHLRSYLTHAGTQPTQTYEGVSRHA
jgi:ABC-type nitrate/sulfonate/bicarbonate transport system ATPase subunit